MCPYFLNGNLSISGGGVENLCGNIYAIMTEMRIRIIKARIVFLERNIVAKPLLHQPHVF
jgi:hypothetical protein